MVCSKVKKACNQSTESNLISVLLLTRILVFFFSFLLYEYINEISRYDYVKYWIIDRSCCMEICKTSFHLYYGLFCCRLRGGFPPIYKYGIKLFGNALLFSWWKSYPDGGSRVFHYFNIRYTKLFTNHPATFYQSLAIPVSYKNRDNRNEYLENEKRLMKLYPKHKILLLVCG